MCFWNHRLQRFRMSTRRDNTEYAHHKIITTMSFITRFSQLINKLSTTPSRGHNATRSHRRIPYSFLIIVPMLTALAPHTTAAVRSLENVKISSAKRPLFDNTDIMHRGLTTAIVTDIEKCYNDLIEANAERNGLLTTDEFVDFINLQSGNSFANVTSFKELPLELIQLFNFEACDCETTSCCGTNNSTNATSHSINTTTLANTTSFCSDVTYTLASIVRPSSSPTISPTKAPTKRASSSPTVAPTNQIIPTPAPTNQTFRPTVAPTTSQFPFTGPLNISITFIGCNVNNYTIPEILSGQNNGMIKTIEAELQNRSNEVLTELRRRRLMDSRRKNLNGHRQLTVALNNVSVIDATNVECYTENSTDIVSLHASSCSSCLQLQSIVSLNLDGEDSDVVQPLFKDKLYREITANGLGYPGFFVTAPPTSAPTPATNVTKPPDRLSTAAVIGIACAAFAAGILTIAGLYTNQRRLERRRKAFGAMPPHGTEPSTLLVGGPQVEQDKALMGVTAPAAGATLAAAAIAAETLESPEDRATANTHNSGSDGDVGSLAESDVSSSQAGSSGWSSSAGLSSLNTGSFDSADLESGTLLSATSPTNIHKNLTTLLLATGGAGKLLLEDRHRSGPIQFASPTDSRLSVYKSEPGEAAVEDERIAKSGVRANDSISSFQSGGIDAAIKSGAATATLLAGRSLGGSSSEGSAATSDDVESESAKELDQLVDTGDWEGVVLAASKFERRSPSSFEENLRPARSSAFIPSHPDSATFDSVSGGTSIGSDSLEPGNTEGSKSSVTSGENVESVSSGSAHDDDESGSTSPEEASSVGLSSVLSPATSSATGISETKRAEIRAEVEALVRRVVPDEINNVDEMMNQFKGREEELVETLRTMQERNIAKRERAARNKSAKLEAKREVRQKRKMMAAKAIGGKSTEGGLPPSGLPPRSVGAAGAAIAVTGLREETPMARLRNRTPSPANLSSNSEFSEPDFKQESQEITRPTDTSQTGDALKEIGISDDIAHVEKSDVVRESLEKAIEAGNWEAVGDAAALMMDHNSTTSSSTHDLRNLSRLSENDSLGYASGSTGISNIDPNRKAELESMIEAADWTGVALAAKQLSKGDPGKIASPPPQQEKEEKPKSWRVRKMFGRKFSKSSKGYADTDSDGDDVFKTVTARGLQEEQDALAQAEIWMAIAAQSKQEGTKEAKGASAAADWAIERSLSALQSADRGTSDGGDNIALHLPGATKDDTSV